MVEDRYIHAAVKNAMRHAALPLLEVDASDVVLTGGRREDLEEPHVVLLDDPDQLHTAIESYLDLSQAKSDIVEEAVAQYEHEVQHYDEALAVGASEVVNTLAIYGTGKWPFRKYRYRLGTAPLDVTDPDAAAAIIGHPEVLSEGDWKGLDEAGLSLEAVAAIAARKGWPRPLSLPKDGTGTPHAPAS